MVIHHADLSSDEYFTVFLSFAGFAILSIIFNVFLLGLASDYPSGLSAWLLYPVRKLKNVLTKLREEWKNALQLILVGGCGILGSVCFILLVLKAWDIAVSQDYSITNIYSEHGLILGTAVVFTLLLIGLFFLGVIIFLLVGLVKFLFDFKNILSDQIKFKKLSYFSKGRPSTATEAVQILQSFKSDVGKAKYTHALFKWLPVMKDPQVFIDEASEHQGVVSEKLYQLAEIWEDSLQRKM